MRPLLPVVLVPRVGGDATRRAVDQAHRRAAIQRERDDGSFHVAAGPLLMSVANNVTVQRWTNAHVTVGGALFFNAQPAVVYERDGRAFLRTLSFARTRGVRH